MKHETLSQAKVKQSLKENFDFSIVNVDEHPKWMDLPGIQGLPTLVFFDENQNHVLSKSGFQSEADLIFYLKVVAQKIRDDELEPYPKTEISFLKEETLTPTKAKSFLKNFEFQIFIAVNSNQGGFNSPSVHPRPKLLWELEQWVNTKQAPRRVEKWIQITVDGALRGSSPNFTGHPLPDMDFSNEDLRLASKKGANYLKWRKGIETLPTKDPYYGLRDYDGGFFRYDAGPGWYHPHFERLVDENLAWVLLLKKRGKKKEALKTWKWITKTFTHHEHKSWLNHAQESDPFYYRLPPKQRKIKAPKVGVNPSTLAQAWATMVDPKRCKNYHLLKHQKGLLISLDSPRSKAPVDVIGETLIALNKCPSLRSYQKQIADEASTLWKSGLPKDARLHRLAAGLCAAKHASCASALSVSSSIGLDPKFAPPLMALQNYISDH